AGIQPLELRTDYRRRSLIDYKGAVLKFKVGKEISVALRLMAKNKGVTLNSLLLSSINILLSKYSGQNDIVTGSPNANRHYHQTEGLIGFFVNTQTNRTVLNDTQ